MKRFNLLPSYHFEDNTNGRINNPADLVLRDYTIEGNCGKNLIDESKITIASGYFLDSSGQPSSADKRFIRVQNVKCEPNTKYTLSSNLMIYTIWYTNGSTPISRFSYGSDHKSSITFTTPENCSYLRISLYNTSDNADTVAFEWIQLELGAEATEYEEYKTVGEKSPNLLQFPYNDSSKTINGVTFTDNGDGSITANGTATGGNAIFQLNNTKDRLKLLDPTKTYTLYTGTYSGNGDVVLDVINQGNWVTQFASSYTPTTFKLSDCVFDELKVFIIIYESQTVSNRVFKPQLEEGETATNFSLYGYHIPITVCGKNLIPYPYRMLPESGEYTKTGSTVTIKGVAFTDNGDGSITVNGTAEGDAELRLNNVTIKAGQSYFLSGCPAGGSASTYHLKHRGYPEDFGKGSIITPPKDWTNNVTILVKEGVTVNNLVFKPQYELGKEATAYERYTKAPKTIDVVSSTPVSLGKSISKKANNLKDITLNKGSNVITVDTEIKPKSTIYQYYTY